MRLVGQLPQTQDGLFAQEAGHLQIPLLDLASPGLISRAAQSQHGLALGADRGQLLLVLIRHHPGIGLRELGQPLVALGAGLQQSDALNEITGLHIAQQVVSVQARAPALHVAFHAAQPVVTQVEFFSRKGGRDQFKHVQRHAARVDLFKDRAHGLLRGVFEQLDHRHLVPREPANNRLLKLEKLLNLCGVELAQVHHPGHGVKHGIARTVHCQALMLPGAQIQRHVAVELAVLLAALVHRHDGVQQIGAGL
ncbi:hypothetical protein D9M68_611190 [compost metagenome]